MPLRVRFPLTALDDGMILKQGITGHVSEDFNSCNNILR